MAEKPWAMGIFDMLLIDFKMEETLFKDYQTRFQFDEKLLTMRRSRYAKKTFGHSSSRAIRSSDLKHH